MACTHAPVEAKPAPSTAKPTTDASTLASLLYYVPDEAPPTLSVSKISLESLLYYVPQEPRPTPSMSSTLLDHLAPSLESLLYYVPEEPRSTYSTSPTPLENLRYVVPEARSTPLR